MTRFADGAFGKDGINQGEYSRFFTYTGPQGKSYSHSYNKKGLIRNDDPANLVYAATGAELIVLLKGGEFEQLLLKFGAEAYAAGEGHSGFSKLIIGGIKAAFSGALDPENLNVALFDDAHDIAVINWAYTAYVDPSLSNILTLDDFRRTLRYLCKG